MFLFYFKEGGMAHLPMEYLIEDLNKVFTEQPKTDERTSKIKSLLSAYVKEGHKDWKKYVYFNDVHYTRNLVKMTDDFELMVSENHVYIDTSYCCFQIICWQNGQRSRIHNHDGSHCWMGVVQGKLVEKLYKYITPDGHITTEYDSPVIVGSVCPNLHLGNFIFSLL